MRRSSPPLRSWPATAAGRWMPTATTCAASSSGQSTRTYRCWRTPVPPSSCIAAGWRSGSLPRRRSTGRLSTVCGFYRFAHIDGRIASNPAQYVRRRPQVHPSNARRLDRSELGVLLFTANACDRAHAALAVLLRLNGLRMSEACASNIDDFGIDRGHRVLQIPGKGNKPATIPLVPQTARTIDLAIGERTEGPILPPRRTAARPAHRPPVGPLHRQASRTRRRPPTHAPGRVHHGALDASVPLRDVQIAARHADPPHHDDLRPPPPELRPLYGLRSRRVRRRWLTDQPRTMVGVSTADRQHDASRGAALLPSDLTDEQPSPRSMSMRMERRAGLFALA